MDAIWLRTREYGPENTLRNSEIIKATNLDTYEARDQLDLMATTRICGACQYGRSVRVTDGSGRGETAPAIQNRGLTVGTADAGSIESRAAWHPLGGNLDHRRACTLTPPTSPASTAWRSGSP